MEKKHCPIKGQKLIGKVKNAHNIILVLLIPHKNLCRIGYKREKGDGDSM
jgi:hypothetical protein